MVDTWDTEGGKNWEENAPLSNAQELEELIVKCLAESTKAHQEKYESEEAEKTAALFLTARMKLAYFIGDVELRAKQAKAEIDRVEAEVYFQNRERKEEGKKLTEASLIQFVAKDPKVIDAKNNSAQAEADLKKYNYLMVSLQDGHVFFRGLGKRDM